MSEQSWVKEGAECICIKDVWWSLFGPLHPDYAPKFMQQYIVRGIEWKSWENDGHRIKIKIDGFDDFWCACGFRPVEKLRNDEEESQKVSDDLEKVLEKVR